uniref:Plexin-B1 n=1 Tax=Scleropages formosus TaxID=113540 RepID=A0A8C9W7Z0_SCLFO
WIYPPPPLRTAFHIFLPVRISLNGSPLSHLLLDSASGHIYVGAVNALYHLSPDLELISSGRTGPKLDSPDCLPPIDPQDCTQARETDNTNKILLLEEGGEKRCLIVCGTVLQGTCEKRSLGNVSEVLYQTDNPVDTQYVAANDPRVSTVGVVVEQKGTRLMLVGRGYTSKGPGGIPPITTRRLAPSRHHQAPTFSHEDLGKLVVGSYSEFNNHFVAALRHNSHVYFLFSRRDVWRNREYRTYVSRLCAGDTSFYSYVEVPLSCQGGYNLAQAATLGTHVGSSSLFVAMATGQASTPAPTARSALCVYSMGEVDRAMRQAQLLCYTKEGRDDQGKEEAYIEYEVSSQCLRLAEDSLSKYPCGGEHTPSPIASAVPLQATPSLTSSSQLTAVVTSVEAGNTIVLLGDKKGQLHKVFLQGSGPGTVYESVQVDKDSPVNADLLLDTARQSVYVLTESKVTKVPVSQCEQHSDCSSCLSAGDPYCGWCVLEGRCTRRMECPRHTQPNHWQWSYRSGSRCVTVERVEPDVLSREEQANVSIVPDRDGFLTGCFISTYVWPCHWCALDQLCSHAKRCSHKHIIYNTLIPYGIALHLCSYSRNEMWTTVRLEIAHAIKRFDALLLSSDRVAFIYSRDPRVRCLLLLRETPISPHLHPDVCVLQAQELEPRGADACPCVWALKGSPLVPVGLDMQLVLLGRNLDLFEVTHPSLLWNSLYVTVQCLLTSHHACCVSAVQLYDCAVGQSDCSQCRAVSARYGCVWCGGESPSCTYSGSCLSHPVETCPPPLITKIQPQTGPLEGGILVTIWGSNLGQQFEDIQKGVTVAGVRCVPQPEDYVTSTRVVCELQPSQQETRGPVTVSVGETEPGRSQQMFAYQDPQLSGIIPEKGPVSGGTSLTVQGSQLLTGQKVDLAVSDTAEEVNDTQLVCRTSPVNRTAELQVRVLFGKPNFDRLNAPFLSVVIHLKYPSLFDFVNFPHSGDVLLNISSEASQRFLSALFQIQEPCIDVFPDQMTCVTPAVPSEFKVTGVWFELDNVRVDFASIDGKPFRYYPDPILHRLNRDVPDQPFHFKPGGVIAVEGEGLTLAMTREEVIAWVGVERCDIKTLDSTHLYCEPPEIQPLSPDNSDTPPSLRVVMGKLEFDLGLVHYDNDVFSAVPLAAQVGLAAGAAVVVLVVLVIILMYRRKSKQALRDYKKVLVQLETLEINVGDQCRKEFTDLMTEMMDLSNDVGGPGIPFLDYRTYAERVFFPGQRGAPLSQNLDLPESRRQTVEQGLGQLNNLLNNRLFLIRFIHTLEAQQSFSQRDRGHVASLLTMALHDKLEYFTDVMKTLLGDLVQQYVAKNPKLMLRRTETVVEKMLTNWMSICLYSYLKEVAGEPLYMLYRAIKYQVDKGPVDSVTGKAKRTLNDSHLLREDIDYCSMTLTVLVNNGAEAQPVKVLDIDTITQVKDKILDQTYKGVPFSQRPSADSLDLEWRSGQAGHLTLSDDDVTAIVQGRWKRLNTLQHYKVPDGATVALIPRSERVSSVHPTETPMLEVEEEEGLRLWHLVKSSEDPEIPKHRKSSMRERERAKAIPEIYLTRLLSMKGTLQKFVDDVFVAILSTKRPPPIAVRYFFDFLDDMAEKHGIEDPETVHIWKTNSLPLRFWVNILKNPQFVFDVQVTDSVDAVLSVIAQTFIDSCTTSEHKVGRDSPVNKLLYAREIPRYKQLVERYYSDIHNAASGCYQEMNSTLTELSGSFASEMNGLVALHELYKYINKYYDQIIMALEEDATGQKMQLAYRLQQVAALVENKVTDL